MTVEEIAMIYNGEIQITNSRGLLFSGHSGDLYDAYYYYRVYKIEVVNNCLCVEVYDE